MNVDLEAIAQRGRCEVSSLRIALPLLEQGYSPPFLARYRRDELGGLDESSLGALSAAVLTEQAVAQRREELAAIWENTTLQDPSIGHAIRKSNSKRMLERLGRRLRSETGDQSGDAPRLAVRVLNPQKGDGDDFTALAERMEIADPAATLGRLDEAVAKRLAGDPRVIGAAVRWLVKHARIHIATIHDPHVGNENPNESESAAPKTAAAPEAAAPEAAAPEAAGPETAATEAAAPEAAAPEAAAPEAAAPEAAAPKAAAPEAAAPEAAATEAAAPEAAATEAAAPEAAATEAAAPEAAAPEAAAPEAAAPEAAAPEAAAPEAAAPEAAAPEAAAPEAAAPEAAAPEAAATEAAATEAAAPEAAAPEAAAPEAAAPEAAPGGKPKSKSKKLKSEKAAPKAAKKPKKISPRQRRRRWLVSVLKPLEGKRLPSSKLSAFQVVMLGRALRSQVARCSFEYDAAKLVAELQRTVGGFNRNCEGKLREIVLQNEADIREAAEGAWWDELQERASARLVGVAADHLRRQTDRGGVDAKIVMSIDAVGPRTAATTIVSADGRLLHSEDLPCQLSAAPRSQAVARMGELIHHHHVDLIVISNGPSRRACMVAVGDLIAASPAKSLRWTLADRSGADAYASSLIADQEMKSTPRRFRAAAWLAFSVLQPAQALAKVDPLKLRLGSFQRELADDALRSTLEDVMTSGASRGGVDVNTAPVSWLSRLPGMTEKVAESIDQSRRKTLFDSRASVVELEAWDDNVSSRQAISFLRVFESDESLDGTLIHPDDYVLAKKLGTTLEIELPPNTPPGYVAPDYHKKAAPTAAETTDDKPAESADENANVDEASASSDADATQSDATGEDATGEVASGDAASETAQLAETAETTTPDPASDPAPSESQQPESEPTAESSDSAEPDAPSGEETSAEEPTAADKTEPSEVNWPVDAPAADPAPASPTVEIPDPIRRPRPDEAKIKKCIKEWQVGRHRVNQLVHWLCDPFGDSDASGTPPAVLSTMPSLAALKQGDQVIGVVVGVMPFGVFVELAPDCSGLIHVSKVSDGFVDDLHEAVQVGDVVTAWVTGVDEKRRRVALSAVSPEREAELLKQKSDRDPRGGNRDRGGRPQRSGQPRRDQAGGNRPEPSRGGGAGKEGAGKPRGGDGNRSGGRGGQRGGGQRGGPRDRDRRGGGDRGRKRQPETYRVVSKEPAKPISEAMEKGDEPLRSFGDLMQFYTKEEKQPAPKDRKTPKPSDATEPAASSAPPEPAQQPEPPAAATAPADGAVAAEPSADAPKKADPAPDAARSAPPEPAGDVPPSDAAPPNEPPTPSDASDS